VRVGQRRLAVVADLLVEVLVLGVGDVALAARPQRGGLVDGLPLVGATCSFFSSSHFSLRIRMGSEMWSEYLLMMDLSFQR
jgi:hypothetical protein